MQAAKQPFLLEENRLVAGRIIITAWPTLDAPKIDRLQIKYPDQAVIGEPEIVWLLFQSVWEQAPLWWPMWKEGIRIAKREPIFLTALEGITIRACQDSEWWLWDFADDPTALLTG